MVSPVRLLVNVPIPVPSKVLLLPTVGFGVVLQQIPLAKTASEPSLVTVPPQIADVSVIPIIFEVDITGSLSFLQLLARINTNPPTINTQSQISFIVFILGVIR
jgi:hypothetical protein